ncbi:MAG TPA: IspD/TarI family cytidylyltransferase [Stackebrandtia sp.]|jgi:2-C-methyl-D-erythritol 4-phosphate cytidylyltransferase|uniref:IspD/TarI family cytidylyltransferase n=1 Tax=Stackebrandtia sp. TaxID=2023065 RepID=UPI002D70A1E6|nr:IspD/TarI family cytidylyltransferase [Stackebrandtia sp.]HZE37629.1 IspD/TarI family cytidylyltransferase [Stackebrandtia sp.]
MSAPVVAAVLAGGTGTRLGAELPKQLIRVAGKEILAHTLDVFEACSDVDEIRVFMVPHHVDAARDIVGKYAKAAPVAAGGRTRADSARLACRALEEYPRDTKLLVHDAVRPLVDVETVTECVRALDHFDAVTVAVPSTDTIVEIASVDGHEVVTGTPPRAALRRVQTPQGFRLHQLARAHALAAEDPDFVPTDDCGVVRRYLPRVAIGVVPGSEHNVKITHTDDLPIAEHRLSRRVL